MTTNRTTIQSHTYRACIAVLIFAMLSINLLPTNVSAAAKPKYNALFVNQIDRYLVLPPGKALTAWVEFQNTGTSSWPRTGAHAVTFTTDKQLGRASIFQTGKPSRTWRPTRMVQSKVVPGETARFRFALKAPNKPGIRIERFALVVDGVKISGSDLEFVIVVGSTGDASAIVRAESTVKNIALWVRPGERVLKPLSFFNNGYTTIRNEGYGAATIVPAQSGSSMTMAQAAAFTMQSSAPVDKKAVRAKTTSATLDVIAPTEPGTYTEQFGLMGPKGVFAGSNVSVQLTVSNEPEPIFSSEPSIRVGIFSPVLTKPFDLTADGPYEIRTADTNELLATMAATNIVNVQYDATAKTYTLKTPTVITANQAVRFIPLNTTIMEIKSSSLGSYNRFRGVLEIRYATATGQLWVINELPMETYLHGLAETGSTAPDEFVRTLITAARSYALYKVLDGKKHDVENYKINSTTDQVYKGYNYEVKTPNITAAVDATRGLVVTHPSMVTENNKPGTIVAAYSSCTDGRTRSYYERWGGPIDDYPYLLSVPDPNGICTTPPYPKNYILGESGNHMVGMSARGALITSQQPGMTFDAILRYYYTGTSVVRVYL